MASEFSININEMGLRFLMLQSHYRSPLDFSETRLEAAKKTLRRLVMAAKPTLDGPPIEIIEAVANDLNTPKALALLSMYRSRGEGEKLFASLRFLGFFGEPVEIGEVKTIPADNLPPSEFGGGFEARKGQVV